MKVYLFLLVPLTSTAAFSVLSSFTGRRSQSSRASLPKSFLHASSSLVMYDSSRDPPSSNEYNAWSVLANTEKWISATLAASENGNGGNPYTRKEVSYACENAQDSAMIVASIFRRLKDVREAGELHGKQEQERQKSSSPPSQYEPHTMRQTQVIVLPANKDLSDSFPLFDRMIETINQARRNARDYITDLHLEKLEEEEEDDDDDELSHNNQWSVSVNLAHLHPDFGKKTSQELLEEMQQEEETGEVDLNLQEYKKKRLQARQSPYPTIVIEVRATPAPDFGTAPPPPPKKEAEASSSDESITSADIQKLEALFGKSAAFNDEEQNEEDAFYNAIGAQTSIQEVSAITPLNLAQQWLAQHHETDNLLLQDDNKGKNAVAFTESDATHVDAAYEFIFMNIAMLADENNHQVKRQYLVLPSLFSSSATSFEKFSMSVETLINVLPDLKDKIGVSTFHPEHVDAARRSPVPIYVLEWKGD